MAQTRHGTLTYNKLTYMSISSSPGGIGYLVICPSNIFVCTSYITGGTVGTFKTRHCHENYYSDFSFIVENRNLQEVTSNEL